LYVRNISNYNDKCTFIIQVSVEVTHHVLNKSKIKVKIELTVKKL